MNPLKRKTGLKKIFCTLKVKGEVEEAEDEVEKMTVEEDNKGIVVACNQV